MSKISKVIAIFALVISFSSCNLSPKPDSSENPPDAAKSLSEEAKQAFERDPGFASLVQFQKEAEISAKSSQEAEDIENALNDSAKDL